ncbi:MAG: hypothetical protein ACRDQF_04095 [Thermocrispum sp.]
MAYGTRAYLGQARDLALSLRLHGTQVPLALITEWPDDQHCEQFDVVVPMRGKPSRDCRPKLDLDTYTPFRRTLYLDSDGLAVRDVRFLLNRFTSHDFVVLGSNISTGRWYGDVAEMCEHAGSASIPKFSGGFMYFTTTPVVTSIFQAARAMAARYDDLRLDKFNGGIADEPLLSIALAHHRVAALPTMPDTSASLLGTTEPPDIDVLAGRAVFTKYGRTMKPAIVHFAGDHSSRWRRAGATYRRQRRRLHRAATTRLRAASTASSIKARTATQTDSSSR